LFGFTVLLVAVTRLPFFPPHLYSFDSVNLALALERFDPTLHQPQPPGYPLFVLEARLVNGLLGSAEQTFAVLGLLVSGLAVGMLYLVGKELFSPGAGMVAAALLFVNPAFWYGTLTSPLRPHLALASAVAAYFCWRAKRGDPWPLYAASLALGVGGGARPELFLLLLPLWIWAAWQTRERNVVVRSALILAGFGLLWTAVLVVASGGPQRLLAYFADYARVQTEYTSIALEPSSSWRRAAGRAVLWTSLGAIPWLWALPFGWLGRRQVPQWERKLLFLTIWFLPAFLFHLAVHVGDPDHTLVTIPVVGLLGGFCLDAARQRIGLRIAVPLVAFVLLGNLLLFFVQFPFPQGPEGGAFRGLASLKDAFLGSAYESSYHRVRFIDQRTRLGLQGIADLKSQTDRPVVVIWARDGEPVWRKLAYYLPGQPVYVLAEKGDAGASGAEARLYLGNRLVTRYTGQAPFRLSVEKEARLIWVAGGNTVAALREVLPLQSFSTLHYIDLPPDSPSIQWGSFELVPE
jgi:hypothetical protein